MVGLPKIFHSYPLKVQIADDRTAWDSGAIHIVAMKHRGIKHDHVFFNSMTEFLPKFQELMDKHNIKLIRSERVKEVRIG